MKQPLLRKRAFYMSSPAAMNATFSAVHGHAAASAADDDDIELFKLRQAIQQCHQHLKVNEDSLRVNLSKPKITEFLIENNQAIRDKLSGYELELNERLRLITEAVVIEDVSTASHVRPFEPAYAPSSPGFCAMPLPEGCIRLNVTLLSGIILKMQISPLSGQTCIYVKTLKSDILGDLKQRGIAQSEQACLMFWGRRLESPYDITTDELGISNDSVLHFVPSPPGKLHAQFTTGRHRGVVPISACAGKQFDVFRAVARRVKDYATSSQSPWNIDSVLTNLDDAEYLRARQRILEATKKAEDDGCKDFCEAKIDDDKYFRKTFRCIEFEGTSRASAVTEGPATPSKTQTDDEFNVYRPTPEFLHLYSCRFRDNFMQKNVPLKLSDEISHKLKHIDNSCTNASHSVFWRSANQPGLSAVGPGIAANKHPCSVSLSYDAKGLASVLLPFSPEHPLDHRYQKTQSTGHVWMYRFKNKYEESVQNAEAACEAEKIKISELSQQRQANQTDPQACADIDTKMAQIIAKLKQLEEEKKPKQSAYNVEEEFLRLCPFVFFPERVSQLLESRFLSESKSLDIQFEEKEALSCRLKYKKRDPCLLWKFDLVQMYAYCDPVNDDDPDIELRRQEESWILQKEAPFSCWSYRFLTNILEFERQKLPAYLAMKASEDALDRAERAAEASGGRVRVSGILRDQIDKAKSECRTTDGPPFVPFPRSLSDDLEGCFIKNRDVYVSNFLGFDWNFKIKRMSATKMTGSEFECFPEMELQREEVSWDRPGDGEWTGEWVSMSPAESGCIEDWYQAVGEDKVPLSEFKRESFFGGDKGDHMKLKIVDRTEKDCCVRLVVSRGPSGMGDFSFTAHRHVCTSFRGDVLYQCAMWPHHILNMLDDDRTSSVVEPFHRDHLVEQLWYSMKSAFFLLNDQRPNLEYKDTCIMKEKCDFSDCSYCLHKRNFQDVQHLLYDKIHPAVKLCVRLAGMEICRDLIGKDQPEHAEERSFKSYPFKSYYPCNHCHGNTKGGSGTDACISKTVCQWALHLTELHKKKKDVTGMDWFTSKVKRWPLLDGPDQICKLYCKTYQGHFHCLLNDLDTANLCNAILKCRQFESWFLTEDRSQVLQKVDEVKSLRNKSLGHATKIMLDSKSFKVYAKRIFDFVLSFALVLIKSDDVARIRESLNKWNDLEYESFRKSVSTHDAEGAVDWTKGQRASLVKALDFLHAKRNEVFMRQAQIRITPGDRETLLKNDPIVQLDPVYQMLISDAKQMLETIDESICLDTLERRPPMPSAAPAIA